MGRLIVCFEYISFRLWPSSETVESPMGYKSAEALRIMPIGGDCSTMAGSPWLNGRGETDCGTIAGFTMGDRKVLLYGVLKLDVGRGVCWS
jgi:hypothetical protein